MKILFLTNLYPPHYIGGYEQLCLDVVIGLTDKGHDCHILTSTYGVGKRQVEGRVYRVLELEGDFHGKRHSLARMDRIRLSNEAMLAEMVNEVSPDIIFVWSMRRFSRSLLLVAEKLHKKVVYYVTDDWLLDQYRPTCLNLKKYLQSYRYLFARPELRHVICSSQYMKQEMIGNHIPLDHAQVVHNGVDLEPYLNIQRNGAQNIFLILFAGRLVPQKGVHTLLEAFRALVQEHDRGQLHLSIIGGGEKKYIGELKEMALQAGLDDLISFTGNVPREVLAEYFANHDIFVFPSIWQEPFSLTLIMALASGIPIVGTLTGGSKEILRDLQNCLAFKPGDSVALAEKLELLFNNADLRQSLAKQGRIDSLACALPTMIAEVERVLVGVFSGQ